MSVGTRRGSAHREARRVQLLDAADAMIREVGPDASMRAIAEAAGITKPILYRYFGDKGGLYRALADRYIEPLIVDIRTALRVDITERPRATVDVYLRFIEDNPQAYRFLIHRAYVEQPTIHTTLSVAARRIGSEVAQAMRTARDLEGPAAIVADAVGHAMVGMIHVAGEWWLENRGMPREELADHLTALLVGGLSAMDSRLGAPR